MYVAWTDELSMCDVYVCVMLCMHVAYSGHNELGMCVLTHVYVLVCLRMYACLHVCTLLEVATMSLVCVYLRMYIYWCVYICMYACVHVCMLLEVATMSLVRKYLSFVSVYPLPQHVCINCIRSHLNFFYV